MQAWLDNRQADIQAGWKLCFGIVLEKLNWQPARSNLILPDKSLNSDAQKSSLSPT